MTSPSVIQEPLKANGATGLDETTVRISADGVEAPPSDLPRPMSATVKPTISHRPNEWLKTYEKLATHP